MFKIVRFLAPDIVGDLLCGRGALAKQTAAALIKSHLESEKPDRVLDPVMDAIGKKAVRRAGLQVITGHGRINYKSRHAPDLLPAITDLAVWQLLRLKLERMIETLRDKLTRS